MKKLILFILFPLLGISQIQIGQDIDGEAAGSISGESVSISADGTVLATGAIGNNGSVKIFNLLGNNWVQSGQTINVLATNSYYGVNISLSENGNIVAIGAFNDDGPGKVKIFQNINNVWTHKLVKKLLKRIAVMSLDLMFVCQTMAIRLLLELFQIVQMV